VTQQPVTQADRFRHTLEALHQALLSLSTARDWLNAMPRPLPAPAAAARLEILDRIGETKTLINAMKGEVYRALEELE
jgi:hypothetical protein